MLQQSLERLLKSLEVPVLVDASVDHRPVEDSLTLLRKEEHVVVELEKLFSVREVVVYVLRHDLFGECENEASKVLVLSKLHILPSGDDVVLDSVEEQGDD